MGELLHENCCSKFDLLETCSKVTRESSYVKDSLTPENAVPALKVKRLLRFGGKGS